MSKNPWELYSSMDGWQDVSARLDAAWAEAKRNIYKAIGAREAIKTAAQDAFSYMEKIFDQPENSDFGASDSEPRAHLAFLIERELRGMGIDNAQVDRWGGVSL